jgi:hypothetical protein
MPVDAFRRITPAAAYPEDKRVYLLSIRLILIVMGEYADYVPGEFRRPVAFLAGLSRRSQVLHRYRNRPLIGVEHYREYLRYAADLGLDQPGSSRPHVTCHTIDMGMGRHLVDGILRFHHAVTQLATELGRVHPGNESVASHHKKNYLENPCNQEENEPALPPRGAEVQVCNSSVEPLHCSYLTYDGNGIWAGPTLFNVILLYISCLGAAASHYYTEDEDK